MLGYTFNTEQEAINARQLCAIYAGLPNPQGDTLYWVNYNYSQLDNLYYIQHVDGLELVLGEPINFEITIQNGI
jgi:hypothetical protein